MRNKLFILYRLYGFKITDINKIKNRQTSPDENEHVHEKNHKFTKNCLVKCIKMLKKTQSYIEMYKLIKI
jgi:hypothetical protein